MAPPRHRAFPELGRGVDVGRGRAHPGPDGRRGARARGLPAGVSFRRPLLEGRPGRGAMTVLAPTCGARLPPPTQCGRASGTGGLRALGPTPSEQERGFRSPTARSGLQGGCCPQGSKGASLPAVSPVHVSPQASQSGRLKFRSPRGPLQLAYAVKGSQRDKARRHAGSRQLVQGRSHAPFRGGSIRQSVAPVLHDPRSCAANRRGTT